MLKKKNKYNIENIENIYSVYTILDSISKDIQMVDNLDFIKKQKVLCLKDVLDMYEKIKK